LLIILLQFYTHEVMYQNTIQAFKHSKTHGKDKLHYYRKTLESICHQDVLQTMMFKNDDYVDEEFYESTCLFNIFLYRKHICFNTLKNN
jgi:ubiquinone/menaquinone biosynthesis C-methylase UbiE